MLPHRTRLGRVRYTTRTAVDGQILERTGLDEFSLRRLRKAFAVRTSRLPWTEWKRLAEGGTCPRFQLMITVLRETWTDERWNQWLRYLEHTLQDIDDMCAGEYPISPYLIRVFSALFGIKIEFLLLGTAPCIDREGASIDIWPVSGIR